MPRRVPIWLALTLLAGGCGGEPVVSSPPATAAATPAVTPSTAAPRADDLDGDGLADLVAEAGGDTASLVVVPGSRRGLDPAKRTVVSPEVFRPALLDPVIRADLDGDGFGDVLAYGTKDDVERSYILWGGPRGIGPATPAAYRAVAGDFDGDGAADLATAGQSDTNLVILYGPFSRDGKPARQTTRPSPTGAEFWRMTADRVNGRRPTGLIVYEADDGEQTSGRLLEAGQGGLAQQGRTLNPGMSATFGDFDGDGARDVAVGDDGSRNNEPGFETEPPTVDRTLTVYYGNGATKTFKGTAGPLVAGDFDGDGRDDLAFGGAEGLFWGGRDGLRPGGAIAGTSPAVPLTAGDYDGDGDDELVFAHGEDESGIIVTDGRKVLNRFGLT
ncbi:hypothetical protein SAMN05444920_1011036 [Nonomuraea solani]|uniref:Repeat domain-containing protein n=1 Tax=Nonomuraea solani TaxID=1144553 RepID=A0A1H5VZA7_9ACTN|nr:VCBS repeat-containing protein [Nonomuraea solani]SEF92595.1 hypothetical protein SAMN05444920_1011036 [Nonomuraea solani]